MPATNMAEAKARGLQTYMSATPCAAGHLSARFKNGQCCECARLRKVRVPVCEAEPIGDLAQLRTRLDRITAARVSILLAYRQAPPGEARTAAARVVVGRNMAEDRLRSAIQVAERAERRHN